ncbi:MAG TPA: hypothetical protein VMQ60_07610 [Acidobacteriaceae bacterium]|jgi:hypothetical protein|nr:hypothetical protein [Acidobacteriaceae bacterium]
MKFFRQFLAVLVITLIATHAAYAGIPDGGGGGAPEIDPAMGMGALAFLSGAILVIRGRIRR